MWMVERNEHSKNLKMSTDLIHSRKLRPVVPRSCSSIQSHAFSTITTPCCFCVQNPSHHSSWNHNNLTSSDVTSRDHYGVYKRETLLPLVSSSTTRWNPTGEQLQALEEMYRRGLRTPTAEQIQQIASKLRRYGRIEGKNVFYWFQNHKARERQKIKRRQLNNNQPPPANKKMRHLDHHTLHARPTGLDRKSFETGNPSKKLPTLSNCTTPSQDSVSMQGGAVIADGWIGLNQKELQQKNQQIILTTDNRNEKCWQLNLSSSSTAHKTTAERDSGQVQENSNPFDTLNLSLLLMTPKNFEGGIKENQTLELFPVRCNDLDTSTLTGFEQEEESYQDVATTPTRFAAKEFIEFLPTKC